jgi:glutamate synthase (NADPH/NADH) small chain
MAVKMQGFVDTARRMPDKRGAEARRRDFLEIYAPYPHQTAQEQARRCSQCGIPYCQLHCPLSNTIPDWLKLAAEDRLEEAYELSSATNTFPEICGRICPQDRLCEGNCVIEQSTHGAVTIGQIERTITDTAWRHGWIKPPRPAIERAQSVGIIGGGPAGLAAAERLRRRGYQVVVYDRHDRIGGLLIYGIPGFKLEKDVVTRRVALLEAAGVQFQTGFTVGRDASLDQLRRRHHAVLIATGVYKARDLTLPGSTLDGIVGALDYLIASNRKSLGDSVPGFDDGTLNAAGRDVVVIGGGDTAMDCVRTAVRQGARSVRCLYRRNRANMPGSQREVGHAEEEGVEFLWQAAPEAFVGDQADGPGRVRALRAHRIHLGVADATGRQSPQVIADSSFTLPCDLVITALGFDPEPVARQFRAPELRVSRWGTLVVDPRTLMTSLPGVFAAGDIVRGGSLVVWAIRDGRDAADGIDTWLRQDGVAEAAD